jgi:hypothetical protein
MNKEQKMSKRAIYFLLIMLFCCSCVNKKTNENIDENEFNDNNRITDEIDSFVDNIVYVASFDGVNLLSEPDINSEVIKLLPKNTKLVVHEKIENPEEINDFNDYWYMVDTGHEKGWVFGAYLFYKPITNKIMNLQLSKMLEENDGIESHDNEWIVEIKGAIFYNNRDTLTVYASNTKESDNFLTDYKNVFLIRIDEPLGWFYLTSNDYKIQGYVYLYDISEKSFYGDLEKMKRSGNYYESLLNTEYEIIKRHKNIKRYGPLITINHKDRITEIWDTSYGLYRGIQYLLLDYYPEYNEILIYEQYYEGFYNFIYNLEFNEYRCERIDVPYFNDARTYLITKIYIEGMSRHFEERIKIYKINNGYYEIIYEKTIEISSELYSTETIKWINDDKVCIDYDKAGSITINIGNEISVENDLVPVVYPV